MNLQHYRDSIAYEEFRAEVEEKVFSETFTINRFRASAATELLKQGAGLEEIKAFLGHAYLSTTINYIKRHDLHMRYYSEMTKHLENIKRNATERYQQNKLSNHDSNMTSDGTVFETGICSCSNPWNPPDNVKKSTGYKEGHPCISWNQCLFCENVLITQNSLPKLIAYQARLEQQLDSFTTMAPKKSTPISRAILLIEEILKSDAFNKNDVERARVIATQIEYDELDAILMDGPA